MQTEQIVEEQIRFADGRLAGILGYPAAGAPRRAVLLCSPHPHFAGDMHNNVVEAAARELSGQAVTLRFDYRGVGDSRIDLPAGVSVFDYWDKVETSGDYSDAGADAAAAADALLDAAGALPTAAVGYSFGAVVALRLALAGINARAMVGVAPPVARVGMEFLADCGKPCLLISNTGDFVYSADAMAVLSAAGGPLLEVEAEDEGDHFFRGREGELAGRIALFLEQHV
jgi:uncharacterized protein